MKDLRINSLTAVVTTKKVLEKHLACEAFGFRVNCMKRAFSCRSTLTASQTFLLWTKFNCYWLISLVGGGEGASHYAPIMLSSTSSINWECVACTYANKGGRYRTMCGEPSPKHGAVVAPVAALAPVVHCSSSDGRMACYVRCGRYCI